MPAAADPSRWSLVVPVKAPAAGKSRLDPHPLRAALARAVAIDTVTAAASARSVARIVVVSDEFPLPEVTAAGSAAIEVEPDPHADGLLGAIAAGLTRLGEAVPRAVLLGDLPALRPEELDAALAEAARHPLALVIDADGTGTTLLTAGAGVPLRPAFGIDSAARHRAAGHVPIGLPRHSGLRRDLDTAADLQVLRGMPLGAATHAVLED